MLIVKWITLTNIITKTNLYMSAIIALKSPLIYIGKETIKYDNKNSIYWGCLWMYFFKKEM